MSAQPLLAAAGIAAGYGKKEIVRGIDLAVADREVLLVLGHNGAGKTTLMRALFGLIAPSAGRVTFAARDITGRRPAENVAEGLAFIPQGHGIFPTLSVRDNLELGAFALPDRFQLGARLDTVFALFPILAERQRQIGGTLSGGQQQMLAIGMALMHAPRLMILDEPSLGLAPNLVDKHPHGRAECALQPADRRPRRRAQDRPQDLRRPTRPVARPRRIDEAVLNDCAPTPRVIARRPQGAEAISRRHGRDA